MKRKEPKTGQLQYLEPVISVVFWCLLFISPLIFRDNGNGIDWKHIFSVWRSFIPYLALFLINRFVFLPIFFFRGKRWLFFIGNVVLIAAMAIGINYYRGGMPPPRPRGDSNEVTVPQAEAHPSEQHLERPPENRPPRERPPHHGVKPPGPRDGQPPMNRPPKHMPPLLSFIIVSFLIVGFDTGLIGSVKWAQSEQKRIRAEKDNVESQLAFLQNQVSPHFFMNTLNNIHSLIDIDTEEAKESIIRLSKLMRHLLYDSRVDQIPLKKEIEFIQNYVELMRLRFSDKVKIDLHISGEIPGKSIPPLLFTSFVENAFKHGISYKEPSFIDIRFIHEPGKLYFIIQNSNPGIKKKEGPSGIGIENSRKRLDLLYGESYSLVINETEKDYTVSLNIPV